VAVGSDGTSAAGGFSYSSFLSFTLSTGATTTVYNADSTASTMDGLLVHYIAAGQVDWAAMYGGAGEESIYGIAINSSGSVFIAGTTSSTTSWSLAGISVAAGSSDYEDIFVAKLSSTIPTPRAGL
jgi:hypothetical protein